MRLLKIVPDSKNSGKLATQKLSLSPKHYYIRGSFGEMAEWSKALPC